MDGTSVLVSKGILNATRREGMADPVPLSDTPMQLDFHFVSTPFLPTPEPASHGLPAARQEGTCWKLAKGHRLRLSPRSHTRAVVSWLPVAWVFPSGVTECP